MIAIIGAMDEEVKALKKRINNLQELTRFSFNYYTGEINGKSVVLMKSGIGKVNAAVGTTLLFELFPVDCVINIGTAGGMIPTAEVLDIVISDKVCYHDVDVTGFNYAYGQIPGFPLYFISDKEIVVLAETILNKKNLRYHKGLIVSGDTFVYQDTQRNLIKHHFPDCIALDMEAAAISHVCHIYNKRFIVIRSLSDIAGKASHLSFDKYLEQAAEVSSDIVYELINCLNN